VDVSQAAQVDSWIKGTVAEFQRLDGAANIAGIAGGDGQITEAIVSKIGGAESILEPKLML
jgi:NAD(P)-dependent dehydrogenase (short-subunit alcohol dehydrogenase family)